MLDLATLFTVESSYEAYAGIGSRETPEDICSLMSQIARVLESGFALRSGGAGGADLAFENGLSEKGPKEIYIPWKGFNGSASRYYPDFVTEKAVAGEIEKLRGTFDPRHPLERPYEPRTPAQITAMAQMIAEAFHPAWDRCSAGAKKLHTRNVHQVLGMKLASPAKFVICWTKDGGPTGGTGQAIRIAKACEVPVLNLHDPMLRHRIRSVLAL